MRIVLVALLATLGVASACINLFIPLLRDVKIETSQIDWIKLSALIVALAALTVAWNNFRRGNTAIVKIVSVSFSACQRHGVNRTQLYGQLEIDIKNVGIPLKSPAVALGGFTKDGTLTMPLKRFRNDVPVDNDGSLEKGMIARYMLRTFEMDQTGWSMIDGLTKDDPIGLCIVIFSDNFLLKRVAFPAGSRRRFIVRWNDLAWRVNEWFRQDRKMWGRSFSHSPELMPRLSDPIGQLKRLGEWATR